MNLKAKSGKYISFGGSITDADTPSGVLTIGEQDAETDYTGYVTVNNTITQNILNLNSGTLSLGPNAELDVNTFVGNGGAISAINNTIHDTTFKAVTLNNDIGYVMDLDGSTRTADMLGATSINSTDKNFTIDNINIMNGLSNKGSKIKIADNVLMNNVVLGTSVGGDYYDYYGTRYVLRTEKVTTGTADEQGLYLTSEFYKLPDAVHDASIDRSYTIKPDAGKNYETVDRSLGSMGGTNAKLVVDGGTAKSGINMNANMGSINVNAYSGFASGQGDLKLSNVVFSQNGGSPVINFSNNAGTLTLDNVVFVNNNSGAQLINYGNTTTGLYADVIFKNNNGVYGLIYAGGSDVELSPDALIIGNNINGAAIQSKSLIVPDNMVLKDNIGQYNGSLFYNGSGDMTIGKNVVFQNNTNNSSGGLISTAGNVDIGDNVKFDSNKAAYAKAAYAVALYSNNSDKSVEIGDNAKFINNEITANNFGSLGGIIYRYGDITIGDNAQFTGNKFTSPDNNHYSDGKIIYANGKVTLGDNALFDDNTYNDGTKVYGAGGLIYAKGVETGKEAIFRDGRANGGAAIFSYGGDVIIGENSEFSNNTALSNGIIFATNSSSSADGNITIGAGTTFTGNTVAGNSSGGILYSAGKVTLGDGVIIKDNHFTGTETSGYSGGLIFGMNGVETGNNVQLIGGSAQTGAAVFSSRSSGDITIGDNATIQNNTSALQSASGAIFAVNGDITIGKGSLIDNNKFTFAYTYPYPVNGGAVSSIYGDITITDSTEANPTIFSNNGFVQSSAKSYGGVLYAGKGKITVGDYTQFTGNSSAIAAAIYSAGTEAASGVEIGDNVKFTGNKIFGDNNPNPHTDYEDYSGGVIKSATTVTIGNNVLFEDNAYENANTPYMYSGGLIYADSNITVGDGAKFIGGHAEKGGAIYSNSGTVKIGDNALFQNNIGETDYAAIYGGNSGGIIGKNAEFDSNKGAGIIRGYAIKYIGDGLYMHNNIITGSQERGNIDLVTTYIGKNARIQNNYSKAFTAGIFQVREH